MAIDFKKRLESMMKDKTKMQSKLKMRDESRQNRNSGLTFNRIKTEKGIKEKLLLFKEIALPFDPATGEESADFNADSKARTEDLASNFIVPWKIYWKENPDVYAKVRTYLSGDLDLDNLEEMTLKDMIALDEYTSLKKFTFNTGKITSPKLTGSEYPTDFIMDWERDPLTGLVEGDTPLYLKLCNMFKDSALCLYKKWEAKNPDSIKKNKDDKRRSFLQESPLKEDSPLNLVVAVRLPLVGGMVVDPEVVAKLDKKTILKQIGFRKSYLLEAPLDSLLENYKDIKDIYPDFYVLNMSVPDNIEDASERAMKTSFDREERLLNDDKESMDKIMGALQEYFEDSEDMEITVKRSARIREYNQDVENALLIAVPQEFAMANLDDSQEFLDRNIDMISKLYPEESTRIRLIAQKGKAKTGGVTNEEFEKQAQEVREEVVRENMGESGENLEISTVDVD